MTHTGALGSSRDGCQHVHTPPEQGFTAGSGKDNERLRGQLCVHVRVGEKVLSLF